MLNSISSNFLNTAQSTQSSLLQQLSSGLRINSAADDAAGLSVAVSLSSQAEGLLQAEANANNGISLVDTAASATGQVGDTLQQMRTLALQAGDGSLNAADRQTIQDQIGQLGQQLDQIVGQAQFNGQNLLDGSVSLQLQTGAMPGQNTPLSIGNLSGSALNVAGLDVTTPAGSANAITAIDNALAVVSNQQSQLGAAANGLSAAQGYASVAAENMAAAKSNILDTDYAATSSSLVQSNVQSQVAMKALAMYDNIQKQQIASLLP